MNKETILNDVINYNKMNNIRFHMPGHKGRPLGSILDSVLPYDVTEIKGTDNLYSPAKNGGIEHMYELAREIYGTFNTAVSTGGATLALQTAVTLAVRKYGKGVIICDRAVHKSVINAFALCGVEPFWIEPHKFPEKLPENTTAMLITSPDYYGQMWDVRECKKLSVPLIVDNSHGAHLAYYNGGSMFAYRLGADIVIDSLHKTMPALTGAALIHTNADFSLDEIISAMSMFGSTSPSYLIMESVCCCFEYMKTHTLDILLEQITAVKQNLKSSGYLIAEYAIGDPFRICIKLGNATELYNYLYDNGVVCEFADYDNVILIPSIMSQNGDFQKLSELCRRFKPEPCKNEIFQFVNPKYGMSIRKAAFAESETVCLESAKDKISAEPYAPYPPGIPLIVTGEIFDSDIISKLSKYGFKTVKIVKEEQI